MSHCGWQDTREPSGLRGRKTLHGSRKHVGSCCFFCRIVAAFLCCPKTLQNRHTIIPWGRCHPTQALKWWDLSTPGHPLCFTLLSLFAHTPQTVPHLLLFHPHLYIYMFICLNNSSTSYSVSLNFCSSYCFSYLCFYVFFCCLGQFKLYTCILLPHQHKFLVLFCT